MDIRQAKQTIIKHLENTAAVKVGALTEENCKPVSQSSDFKDLVTHAMKTALNRVPLALELILLGEPNLYWGNGNIVNDYDASTATLLGSSVPLKVLEAALVLRMDPNLPGLWRKSGYEPRYALTAPFQDGDRERVELLLKYGADLKKVDVQYCLCSVVRFGCETVSKLEAAKLAIQYGAKVTQEVINIIPERWRFEHNYVHPCNQEFVQLWRYFCGLNPDVPNMIIHRFGYSGPFEAWSRDGRVMGYAYQRHNNLIPSLMSDLWLASTPLPVPSN